MSDHLARSPLSYSRAGVDGVQITVDGRPVTVVADSAGTLDRLQTASPAERQQILARLAGM